MLRSVRLCFAEAIPKKNEGLSNARCLTLHVIQPGFEPGTRSLEGCCSNPTELLNQVLFIKVDAKLLIIIKKATLRHLKSKTIINI